MEYQKVINLSDDTPDQSSKFRIKFWVEINDVSRRKYNTNSQIKFKTSVLLSSLCDYSYMCILLKETITVPNTKSTAAATNNGNRTTILKKFALFTDCIKIDNAKDKTNRRYWHKKSLNNGTINKLK